MIFSLKSVRIFRSLEVHTGTCPELKPRTHIRKELTVDKQLSLREETTASGNQAAGPKRGNYVETRGTAVTTGGRVLLLFLQLF